MRSAGIICEFNPFHHGHRYLIEQARARGCDTIVCAMSGHVTQRGEIAIADKFCRAEMAVRCGADLVVELPYPHAAAGAHYFAEAGVSLLESLGVDELVFGSESGSLARLSRAAELVARGALPIDEAHQGSARAYFSYLQEQLGEAESFSSNDILGIAYLAAIRRQKAALSPTLILRQGARYRDEERAEEGFSSASTIRRLMHAGGGDLTSLMPKEAVAVWRAACARSEAPADPEALSDAVLTYFRLHEPEELAEYAEMAGGLENRLCRMAWEARDLSEFYALCATKKYTHARIRRAVLFAMTGVREVDQRAKPCFTNLLAANARGHAFLREAARREGAIPVLAKGADYRALGEEACRMAALARAADALFAIATPQKRLPGDFIKHRPFSLSEES